MRRVTYETFCKFGALGNPRFFTRAIYVKGVFSHTEYIDSKGSSLYYVGDQA